MKRQAQPGISEGGQQTLDQYEQVLQQNEDISLVTIRNYLSDLRQFIAWCESLWQQGRETQAEKDLNLKCFGYGEAVERASFTATDAAGANVDKVPLLAARWSLDPARIEERLLEAEPGIAGEPSRRY